MEPSEVAWGLNLSQREEPSQAEFKKMFISTPSASGAGLAMPALCPVLPLSAATIDKL
jgi:hypothetical protein